MADPLVGGPHDYADAFELRLDRPGRSSPEQWVRAGVDAVPTWIKRIAGNAEGFASAHVARSDAEVVVLEESDALMDTVMIGRNVEAGRVLTTVLRYRRPVLARTLWTLVAPLHRRTARRVLGAARM